MELIKSGKNPFDGYLVKLQKEKKKKKINPVHEIVNFYYQWKGIDDKPKEFYVGRYSYGKLAREAKRVLNYYNNDLDKTLGALDQMRYTADKNRFDWSIITCLKHKKDEH